MVTMQQAQQGILKYIDMEIMPHLSGLKKVGLGAYVALAAKNTTGIVEKYKSHPAVEVLGVIDGENNVDIDRLYQATAPMFADGQKVTLTIPLIGELRLDREDVEKLYRYMREGQ